MKTTPQPMSAASRSDWAYRARKAFVGSAQRMITLVCDRIPGVFENTDQEAREAAQRAADEYLRWNHSETWELENADSEATEAYLNYIDEIDALQQAHRNLAAAGLYHLYEQQIGQLLGSLLGTVPKQILLEDADECLNAVGVVVQPRLHDGPINELRLVANVVKHAEGRSSTDLRKVRADLFMYDSFIGPLDLVEPLAGQGLYVSLEQLRAYGAAIVQFWTNVADQLKPLPPYPESSED